MEENNAVIYVRYNIKKSPDELINDPKLIACREFCKERGWHIVKEYVDNGVSGSSIANQTALMKNYDEIKEGKLNIQYVVGYKYSVFSRDFSGLLNYYMFLKKNNIKLISVSEDEAGEKFSKLFDHYAGLLTGKHKIKLSKLEKVSERVGSEYDFSETEIIDKELFDKTVKKIFNES